MSEHESENQEASEQRRVEFKFPLLTLKTRAFSAVFDKLGSLRVSRYCSWISLFLVPFVAAIGLWLIVASLIALLSNPAAGEIARELGPAAILMLPGINPLLPIVYGWLAIVVAVVIHEGAHGIAARSAGFRVKSSGLLFLLFVPIGAFVDVDEEQIEKAKPKASLKVMAAGVGGNIVVAAICLAGLLFIVSSLTPVIDGVYVNDVSAGLPAQAAGLLPKDVLVSVDNVHVNTSEDLRTLLDKRAPGDVVAVTVARGEKWQTRFSTYVNLTFSENRTIMGITAGDLAIEERLKNYQTITFEKLSMYMVPPTLATGLAPFSDALAPFYRSSLSDQWPVFANVLFWIWFVNFNVAIFNALPMYPLDGGRIFHIALKGKLSERTIKLATYAVSAACATIVLLVIIVPFVL